MKYLILIKDEGRTLRIEGDVATTGDILKEMAQWLDKGKEKKAIMDFDDFIDQWLKHKGGGGIW